MRWNLLKERVFGSFYLFFGLLLAVILFIWGLSYSRMMQIVERDAVLATRTVLAQGEQALLENFTNISNVTTRTMIHPTLLRAMRMALPLRDTNYTLLRQCKDVYASLTMQESFMGRSFIFFHNSETFVGDFGASARSQYVYEYYYRYEDMTYAQWKERVMSTQQSVSLWPMATVEFNGKPERFLTYLYATQDYCIRSAKATMLALIPEKAISDCFRSIESIGTQCYLLLNAQGEVLYASNRQAILPDIHYMDFFESGEQIRDIYSENQHKLMIRGDSTVLGISSIAVVDYGYISGKLQPLSRVFTTIFLIAVGIGILLAALFAHLSSLPLRRISVLLGGYLGNTPAKSSGVASVDSSITNIIHINRELADRLEESRNLLKDMFMERLFQTGFDSQRELNSFAQIVSVDTQAGSYAVVVLRMELPETKADEARGTDEMMRLMHIALGQALASLTHAPEFSHPIGLNRIAALFRLPDTQDLNTFLSENLHALFPISIGNMKIFGFMGVSRPFQALMDARNACVEAGFALDYVDSRPGIPTFYSDIPVTAFALYYTMEKETQLIRLIRGGDAEGALAILNEIYERNYTLSPISEQMQRQLAHDVRGTFIRLIAEISVSTGFELKELSTSILDMHSHSGAEYQQALFKKAILTLCEAMNASRQGARGAYINSILEYIQAHCTDMDISLQSVADTFHLSQAYLSRQIRLKTGSTFSVLLEERQMHLAKRCVLETTLNIAQIARKCGYSNTNTFFKAFKRSFGVSPSTMRREATGEM